MRTFTQADFVAWGRTGGQKRAERLTKAQMSKIGRKGAKARAKQAREKAAS